MPQYKDKQDFDRITHLQQTINLPAALAMALWLLSSPTKVALTLPMPDTQVYARIAQLSYQGDFRVQYGAEDPQKITRLVQGPGQLERFETLYADAATTLQRQGILSIETTTVASTDSGGTMTRSTAPRATSWTWDTSPASLAFLQQQVPLPPPLSAHPLRHVVAPAARYQSFKGILTAGPQKAWNYAARKFAKGLLRR